jgi:hypothetical protein
MTMELNIATQMAMYTTSMVKNVFVVKQEVLYANYMATSDKNVTNH